MTAPRDPAAGTVGGGVKLTARHVSEWHEDDGDVLWWHDGEPPYVGSPLDLGQEVLVTLTFAGETHEYRHNVGAWSGYHEWWTPLPEWPEFPNALAANPAESER